MVVACDNSDDKVNEPDKPNVPDEGTVLELDGTGKAVIRNKYDRDVDMFPCYKYCTSHNYFTLCFEGGSDKEDVQLLKLRK